MRAKSACRTPRLVASPAAQLLREPVFGACRYVRSAPPSSHAFETAFTISSRLPPRSRVATAVLAMRTSKHVIETDAVEAVIERQHALDLVRLDHRRQHVAHRERERRGGCE